MAAAYLDFDRNLAPNLGRAKTRLETFSGAYNPDTHLMNTKGIGVIASAMNPNKEDAHWVPSVSYIWFAKSWKQKCLLSRYNQKKCLSLTGNPAPNSDRIIVVAAKADAAWKR